MSFLHLTLLAMGGAALGVPVVLHLLMRPRPKTLVFPAIRFLVSRQRSNQRRLRLQHASLLAARMLLILLLAAALARPRIATAQIGGWTLIGVLLVVWLLLASVSVAAWLRPAPGWVRLVVTSLAGLLAVALLGATATLAARGAAGLTWASREAPVAAALVFDTSPRMDYQHQNQTRLERAQQLAHAIVEQLPRESAVAIADGQTGANPLTLDPVSAGSAIDSLILTPDPAPLPVLASSALEALEASEPPIRELYIFTDLAQAAWQQGYPEFLDDLQQHPDVNVRLIDVGVAEPVDFAVQEVHVPSPHAAQGTDVSVEGVIRYLGPGGGACQVECLVERPDPARPVVRDGRLLLPERETRGRQAVRFSGPAQQTVRFPLGAFAPGTYHGMIRIVGQDGLATNDQGYFTFEIADRRRIAVVAGPGAQDGFLISALDPATAPQGLPSPFDCRRLALGRLEEADLASLDALALLDPPPLPESTWQALGRAVEQGMGLAVFLGRQASPIDQFYTPAAIELLPARVDRQWRSPEGVTLDVGGESHPVTEVLREVATTIPWGHFPVYRHWALASPGLAPGASTIVQFSHRQPALIERQHGQGTVVLMTTPVSDGANREATWNLLPTGFDPWPFVVLMDQLFHYLTQGGMARLNYLTAEPVDFPAWSGATDRRYQLFTPSGQWQDLIADAGRLAIRGTDLPGIYRLRGMQPSAPQRGFAVNWPPQATRLDRLEPTALESLLARDHVQLVKEQDEIERGVSEARLGIDAFAFFALVAALLLALESFLANWFYPRATPASEPAVARQAA